jgi:menaquinol-cytochrome c reductase iron-sulfur subunit
VDTNDPVLTTNDLAAASSAPNRRRFLSLCTDALVAVMGLLLAVPIVAYVCAPFRKRQDGSGGTTYIELGAVNDLPVGEWRLLSLEVVRQDGWDKAKQRHAVWVRRGEGSHPDVAVLSPICPHLGCPVNWYPDKKEFVCPCHGGTFDANGQHISGPPPRSLDPLPHEIHDGQLLVKWEDFKIGVAQRIVVEV